MTQPVVLAPSSLGPSLVRTVVPLVVGALLTAALQLGVDLAGYTELVTIVVTAVYYALARLLEERGSASFGWLLGLAKAPAYSPLPAPSPDTGQTTGVVVTPDEDVPAE